jgi:hypothetical protein
MLIDTFLWNHSGRMLIAYCCYLPGIPILQHRVVIVLEKARDKSRGEGLL